MNKVYKHTDGFVTQIFNQRGELLEQKFISDDTYEVADKDGLLPATDTRYDNFYHPFNMVQPRKKSKKKKKKSK